MVHAFRIVCSTEQATAPQRVPFPSPAAAGSMVEALAIRLQQALDIFGHRVPKEMDEPVVRLGNIEALYRVSDNAPPEAVADRLSRMALGDVDWAVVFMHQCGHDEGGSCGPWEEVLRIGNVPEGVA